MLADSFHVLTSSSASQEIARQLCAAFGCTFSRGASTDENMGFLRAMLRELHRYASIGAMQTLMRVLDHCHIVVGAPGQDKMGC